MTPRKFLGTSAVPIALGAGVFCSELPRCRGFQTWRGLLDVQYEYARADLDDPRPMNATVQELLESFEPTAVPLSQ